MNNNLNLKQLKHAKVIMQIYRERTQCMFQTAKRIQTQITADTENQKLANVTKINGVT